MFGIGAGEFVVILIVGLIVFGPSKLPEVGRALGKVLREFRKAQSALSDTLNEAVEEKKSTPVEKSESEKKSEPEKNFESEKKSESVKKSEPEKSSATVTADDVINLAKERPMVKESSDEKISNGNSNDAPANDARPGNAGAGRGSNGTDK